MFGHGGYFKTPVVGQKIMAAAMGAPVSVMKTAGEGGSWGIAILALFSAVKSGVISYEEVSKEATLPDFLDDVIMKGQEGSTITAEKEEAEGFKQFITSYKNMLNVEKEAVASL